MFILILLLCLPLVLAAQYEDRQVPGIVQKYFDRNRTSPPLVRADITDDAFYGRTLKIKIQGNRNSVNDDLGFAFGAAAAVAHNTNEPIETLWVEMDVRYKDIETTIAIAPADCSIESIVLKTRTFGDWWDRCLEIL